MKYNPLLKYNLQYDSADGGSIGGEFIDANVSTLQDFTEAVAKGSNASVRIYLENDITLTNNFSANFDNIQVYGHDHKINLENYTFTITGRTCYFYQLRFNANSTVSASSASNYSTANIQIESTANSNRFFFEYCLFMNFVCKDTDSARNIINVKNISGSYPSAHLYFMFCECMTNYVNSNINTCTFCLNHNGSYHALTVHQIDYWGNDKEANSTNNFAIVGNSLSGAAKLGWICDGSCTYNKTVTGVLLPNMTNIYNPSFSDFQELANTVSELYVIHNDTQFYADSTNPNFKPILCTYITTAQNVNITETINVNYECVFVNTNNKVLKLKCIWSDDDEGYKEVNFYKKVIFKDVEFRTAEFYINTFSDCYLYNCKVSESYNSEVVEAQYFYFYAYTVVIGCNFNSLDNSIKNIFFGSDVNACIIIAKITGINNFSVRGFVIADNSVICSNTTKGFIIDNALNIHSDNLLPNSLITSNLDTINSSINTINSSINNIQNIINSSDPLGSVNEYGGVIDIYKLLNSTIVFFKFYVGTYIGYSGDIPAKTLLYTFNIEIQDVRFIGMSNNNVYHFYISDKKLYNLEVIPNDEYVNASCTSIILNSN